MPPPGIEPATPCFPACHSNHSAIGRDIDMFKVKVTRSKIMVWCVLQGIQFSNMKALSLTTYNLWPSWSFWKVGHTSRSRSLSQKLWYDEKGLVTRNTHVKYESTIYHGSVVKTEVNFFERSNVKVKVTR